MISNYEKQYIKICENILLNGYYSNNRTGIPTYKLPHQIMQIDLEKEFPILKSKFVAFKTAVKELLWIMQGNNNVKDLQKQNCHVWDEWMMEDGTIGTAYGWIVKNFDLINKLIDKLKNDNQDRAMMINLYQYDYIDGGSLRPCVFNSMWDVTDGRLNCMLVQRSGDIPLGVPFNTTQYAVLVHILAEICNLKVGQLTHVINNAHIYENQIEGIKQQIYNYNKLNFYNELSKFTGKEVEEECKDFKDIISSNSKLKLNIGGKDFSEITYKDIELEGYSINEGNMGKIEMPVSV